MNRLYLIIIAICFIACNDDDPNGPGFNNSAILILNEGNFFAGNGTIDSYEIGSGQPQNSVYEASATIQTAQEHQSQLFVITNAPDRLDILDENLGLVESIDEGLDNPIDLAIVGQRAFVTNWGDINTAFSDDPDAFLAVIDLATSTVVDSVLLDNRPQRIITWNGLLYIANEGSNSVTVMDPTDFSKVDIEIAPGPSNLAADGNGSIWVLCTSGNLMEIITAGHTIGISIDSLTTAGFNEKMALDRQRDRLYFIGGNNVSFTGQTTVYMADLSIGEVRPLIVGGFSLYGIGVHQESGDFYIGDSNGFQSTGTAFRFDMQGNQLEQFNTGIGPNGFVFQ